MEENLGNIIYAILETLFDLFGGCYIDLQECMYYHGFTNEATCQPLPHLPACATLAIHHI